MEHIPAPGGVTISAAERAYELAKSYLDGLEPGLLSQEQLAERMPLVDGAESGEHRAVDRPDDDRQVGDDRRELPALAYAYWRNRALVIIHGPSVLASSGDVDADGEIAGRAAA